MPQNYSEISGKNDEEDDNLDQPKEVERINFISAVKYRFQLLRKTLVKWAALFYIYGVNKDDIFTAFKVNRDPFGLQGSYAFFKFIKQGDLSSVKTFVENDRQFIFEVDSGGKTSLSYACIHDQTEIALYILSVGVNSDLKCYKGHTSLYYAITKRNVTLVKKFLQKGASPWSSQKNPYN